MLESIDSNIINCTQNSEIKKTTLKSDELVYRLNQVKVLLKMGDFYYLEIREVNPISKKNKGAAQNVIHFDISKDRILSIIRTNPQ